MALSEGAERGSAKRWRSAGDPERGWREVGGRSAGWREVGGRSAGWRSAGDTKRCGAEQGAPSAGAYREVLTMALSG